MTTLLKELLNAMEPDSWRVERGFSPEVQDATEALLATERGRTAPQEILAAWLETHQPCLFGRIAAQRGGLSYCILTDDDVRVSDEHVAGKIARARLEWIRNAYEGKSSGFVILVTSNALVSAAPSLQLFQFAQRLAELYLLTPAAANAVCLEEVFLEIPGFPNRVWRWDAGVNFFGIQGDRRWWHDHRIPGGIGLSVNSVGHMAKSGALRAILGDLEARLGTEGARSKAGPLQDLHKALVVAMRTINGAQETVSGPATRVVPLRDHAGPTLPACPVALPEALAAFNYCSYAGWYHTDETLPSEYFRPDESRPSDVIERSLDFTYLFHSSIENPDFTRMGTGRQIRAAGDAPPNLKALMPAMPDKIGRVKPREMVLADSALLARALAGRR